MPTVNEDLLDAAIRHQIELQKYSNSVVRDMMAILNLVDKALYAELASALDHMPAGAFTVQRLQALLAGVRAMNANAYVQVGEALRKELQDFTEFETDYQRMTLERALPFEYSVAAVSVNQVYAAAMAKPFQGQILDGALTNLSSTRARRVEQAVAQGFVEGKTPTKIVQDLRGTKANGYRDGITEIDRRNLQTIVQTATAHTANTARDAVYEANDDILKGVMWSATLDQKTSEVCRIRDHKEWTLNHKPVGHSLSWMGGPPAHWNCRSHSVPLIKSFNEILGVTGIDESKFPKGTRASMDGQVPKSTTYNEWLTRQPAARQDEVLGTTRGKLLRDGKLTADQMYTKTGEYMTLAELRLKYPKAFR